MLQRRCTLVARSHAESVLVSRRRLLLRGAVAGGAVVGLFAGRGARAGSKVPKTEAGYRDAPRGGMRCELCVQFEPPAACKLVDGAVSPSGYCAFFVPKPK